MDITRLSAVGSESSRPVVYFAYKISEEKPDCPSPLHEFTSVGETHPCFLRCSEVEEIHVVRIISR